MLTAPVMQEPQMILPFRRPELLDNSPMPPMTLRQFYEGSLLDWRKRLKARTRAADREAIVAWERFTENPDLNSLDFSTAGSRRESLKELRRQLQLYVSGMEASKEVRASTINKRLKSIRTFFRRMAGPIDFGILPAVPDLGRDFTGSCSTWQIKSTRRPPRELITGEEMQRLFDACQFAKWPNPEQTGICPVRLWRVVLLLLWSFGARTEDHFFRLTWDLVDLRRNLMRFTAEKTSKLQGVPLTPLVISALQSIRSCSVQIFAGMTTCGSWSQRFGWRPGYYTTWSREILHNAHFEINRGPIDLQQQSRAWPDSRPNLLFHHFRKTAVSQLNCYSDKAGAWVAAHHIPGVTAMHYDTPDERIIRAVHEREAERLPACFREYFRSMESDSSQTVAHTTQ
jgi:integrase